MDDSDGNLMCDHGERKREAPTALPSEESCEPRIDFCGRQPMEIDLASTASEGGGSDGFAGGGGDAKPRDSMSGEIYTFKILRYDAQSPEKEPYFDYYKIRVITGLTVLTVLLRIRDELDGTLAFRSSCRSATCGSCAMVINGKPNLACRTQVGSFEDKTIILEPLPNMEVIKDLVVDMTPFWKHV